MKVKHLVNPDKYIVMSIDVGIKNLAICVMQCNTGNNTESDHSILMWNTFNLLEETPICRGTLRNNKQCTKKASVSSCTPGSESVYCKTHCPKNGKTKPLHLKKVKDYLLQDIVLRVIQQLNKLFIEHIDIFKQLDKVNIELQPKINPKMKLISHLIFGKCIDFLHPMNNHIQVRFVSASKKLKLYKGPYIECNLKSTYSRTKKLSILYGTWSLENLFSKTEADKWSSFIKEYTSKRDDLFDTFNMCLNEFYKCSF